MGKIQIDMNDKVHQRLKIEAAKKDITLKELIDHILTHWKSRYISNKLGGR